MKGDVYLYPAPNGGWFWETDEERKTWEAKRRASDLLHAAAPDLLAEHEEWAHVFGRALLGSMQGDDSEWQHLAHTWGVRFQDGSPVLKSAAIAKAKGETHE